MPNRVKGFGYWSSLLRNIFEIRSSHYRKETFNLHKSLLRVCSEHPNIEHYRFDELLEEKNIFLKKSDSRRTGRPFTLLADANRKAFPLGMVMLESLPSFPNHTWFDTLSDQPPFHILQRSMRSLYRQSLSAVLLRSHTLFCPILCQQGISEIICIEHDRLGYPSLWFILDLLVIRVERWLLSAKRNKEVRKVQLIWLLAILLPAIGSGIGNCHHRSSMLYGTGNPHRRIEDGKTRGDGEKWKIRWTKWLSSLYLTSSTYLSSSVALLCVAYGHRWTKKPLKYSMISGYPWLQS